MKFRTRIFAISILTVAAVLTLVISLSWSRIIKLEREHRDARLCMETKRISTDFLQRNTIEKPLVNDFQSSDNTNSSSNRLINDLVDKLRINAPSQLLIYVNSYQEGVLIQSKDFDAQILSRSLTEETTIEAASGNKSGQKSHCQFAFFKHNNKQWRASIFNTLEAKSLIAVDTAATSSQLKSTLREALLVVIPFSLLFSILGAWFITTNTTRPITRLQKSMNLITKKDLSHRLPEHNEDKEFTVLIHAYNTMLKRLEESFEQVSRFTADAAHELKTPLTVLRGKLEQAVLEGNSEQLDLNAILDEVGYLSAITRKLLLLSQADAGSMVLHPEEVNITVLLNEITDDMALLSDELVLHCDIKNSLIIQADITLLRQLLNNLLVNVMRYSLHDRGATISALQQQDNIELTISNYCVPITDDIRKKLFDRFYRGETVQSSSGSGLGLSLSKEIARAHGGSLCIENSAQDVFTLKLLLPIDK